jgi:single-stranded-DNA-specific exonuclease
MAAHKILKITPSNNSLQSELSKELGISGILAGILVNRKIRSVKEADAFLNVKTDNMHDPFLFSDMKKAVSLVRETASSGKRVLLFGDYDVDGVTSLALLKETFNRLGIDTVHVLPNRIKEGYGLGKNILESALKNEVGLVVTADCGISNHKEIQELVGAGIQVIVTDHHEPSKSPLPPAGAIINPKIKGCGYPFAELAGVGVAYKLCQALTGSLLLDDLDLVALGTIADVVPLVDENRIIAKEGLRRLYETKRPGLRALIDSAGISNRRFNSTSVSFILGPRINATGRMGQAEISFNLLVARDAQEAGDLVKVVELHNRERQKIEARILEEAEHLINKEVNFKEHKVIVIAKEDWHHGVLGIVASKLADRFYRPAIVISLSDDLCKGSGRSIKNFHLFQALTECQEFLNAFGGHSHAAGLVITRDNIDDFRERINSFAHAKLSIDDLLPSIEVDAEVDFSQISQAVAFELERLEPFGAGNPEPLFFSRDLSLRSQPQTLSRDTLKFWSTNGKLTHQVIGFGMGSLKESLMLAKSFDMVFTPRIDNWQGDSSVILEAKDMFFK